MSKIRDEEISRLIKYAQGLGLQVIMDNNKSTHPAEWAIDGSQIRIFVTTLDSKTQIILALIHEIAHHLWFIHEKLRLPDLKFEQAIDAQILVDEKVSTRASKKSRKKIFQVENAAIKYWDIIVKDVNIKIPKWKIELTKKYDIWCYSVYLETGNFPKRKERQRKRLELKKIVTRSK